MKTILLLGGAAVAAWLVWTRLLRQRSLVGSGDLVVNDVSRVREKETKPAARDDYGTTVDRVDNNQPSSGGDFYVDVGIQQGGLDLRFGI